MQKPEETRARILRAAEELLAQQDVSRITVRQIAQRAAVGVGLVNYHFGSKDALLGAAVGGAMAEMAERLSGAEYASPREKLSTLLCALYSYGAARPALMRFVIREGMERGEYGAPLALVPILREILGEGDAMRLRLMALQLLHPIQTTCLAPEAFALYSGVDISDPAQRAHFVYELMRNLGLEEA